MQTIAVVGRSRAVARHVERYARIDDAAVSAIVCDGGATPESAVSPTHETLDAAVESVELDAVDVCGPRSSAAVLTALDANLAVRCDPPVAVDATSLTELRARAAASRGWITAASVNRFSRLYERIREQTMKGAIGSLGVARVKRTAPFPDQSWNARYDDVASARLSPEATLCAVAAHDFDVLQWLFGPIDRTFARVASDDSRCHAHVLAQLRSGAKAHVEITWDEASTTPSAELEFAGDKGMVRFSGADVSAVSRTGAGSIDVDAPKQDCYARTLRSFVETLTAGATGPGTVDDAARTARTVLATRRSIVEGRPVTTDEVTAE